MSDVSKRVSHTKEVDDSRDARICINYNDPSTKVVLRLLSEAGFHVRSVAASGVSQPRVMVRSGTYDGVKQIRKMIDSTR